MLINSQFSKNKSRSFFLKIFGGLLISTLLSANDQIGTALGSTKEALLISTGIKAKVASIKDEYKKVLLNEIKKTEFEKELLILGLVTKSFLDQRVEFTYQGKTYVITNNSIQLRISF